MRIGFVDFEFLECFFCCFILDRLIFKVAVIYYNKIFIFVGVALFSLENAILEWFVISVFFFNFGFMFLWNTLRIKDQRIQLILLFTSEVDWASEGGFAQRRSKQVEFSQSIAETRSSLHLVFKQ